MGDNHFEVKTVAEPASSYYDIPEPDVSHLITEDDTPLDNFFQDKQAVLLTDALNASWSQGRPFLSATDVPIFATNKGPCIVPDMLLSVGVDFPENIHEKKQRVYYMWRFGKPPEVVIEIVSNSEGREDTEKLKEYARIKVPYYVIYDPWLQLSPRPLRVFQLSGASYVEKIDRWFPEVGLGLTTWTGVYDGMQGTWLRWCDERGILLATGLERAFEAQLAADAERERAQAERGRADSEQARADAERERADAERDRADIEQVRRAQLEQKLRELGIDPGTI
jgi:Uma2 family endonuclease